MEQVGNLATTRASTQEDLPFIFASWLRGLKHGNELFDLIDKKVYFDTYHKIIESVVNDPFTRVRIACLKEDPQVILGYCVSNGPRLHWVFVKRAWRGIGIAKSIMPQGIETVTHVTKPARSWLKEHSEVKFNPFQLP